MRYFLELCILSVQKAIEAIDAEIIVIDNNSPDDSCAMVKKCFPELTLIENSENVGFAKANNQGVSIAQGEYICILNPDTIVAEDTFLKIMEASDVFMHMGMVGCRLIDGTGNFLPESKRNIPSPLTSFRRLFGIKLGNVREYYANHIDHTAIGSVDVLVGAFMWGKKKDYEAVAGFDEDYFMYGEDIDLSYKLKKKGLQNYYVGTVSVLHFKGESTDRNAIYVKRFYGAMRLFYRKHFRTNSILDFIVSMGIHLISLVQLFKKQTKEKRDIPHYYLVSENETLQRQLSVVLQKNVAMVSVESVENLGYTNNELIFDNEYLSYGQIIDTMQLVKNEKLTFRIRPAGCAYIVGSDFSDGKGVVIPF